MVIPPSKEEKWVGFVVGESKAEDVGIFITLFEDLRNYDVKFNYFCMSVAYLTNCMDG